ncbi:response regulator [Ramlibacter albus]|uniref:Response regulator transcription factor n=1 Tax=Ramlibacter albus TaxID=2079448 RepID=A0A923ME77_9BURK|nr:response regulator transcription factor [Ramlibacter albus]MBC5767814.1 response regulator transcription factor [Ramlibacter albus]
MKIIVADDHGLVRAGLRLLLDRMPGIEVAGEAADGEQALRLVLALNPDIALLDIAMPKLNGIGVLRRIRANGMATKVILLSMHDGDEYVAEALREGALGYVVKGSAVAELESALATVARDDMYLSPVISSKLAQAFSSGRRAGPGLSTRQTDILKLVAMGRSSKEIARTLGLSLKTVETHRGQIMDRLGIRDIAGIVRYAVRIGLVSPYEG